MPKPLDLDRLKRFEPASPEPAKPSAPAPARAQPQPEERWPSREPVADGQISIKGPLTTIRRFKAMCKEDRRIYADMLNILMDHYEQGRRG